MKSRVIKVKKIREYSRCSNFRTLLLIATIGIICLASTYTAISVKAKIEPTLAYHLTEPTDHMKQTEKWSSESLSIDRRPNSDGSDLNKTYILNATDPNSTTGADKPIQKSAAINKGGGLLNIQINGINDNSKGLLELTATVSSLAHLDEVQYAWLLPEGMTIVTGTATGKLGTLIEGASATIHLTLNNSLKINRQIHLHVYRLINGEANGQMAQFNTVDQARLEKETKGASQKLNPEQGKTFRIQQ